MRYRSDKPERTNEGLPNTRNGGIGGGRHQPRPRSRLAVPHHDTDDYFWLPTDPPYRDKRDVGERLKLMQDVFLPSAAWILSGSLNGWGDVLIPNFDVVIFLTTPREIRLQRLRVREAARFGADAVASGGWRHAETEEFIEWASGYEEGNVSRTQAKHEAWLAKLPCPVQRMDGSRPLPELVAEISRMIGSHGEGPA